ncbi:MAG: hypothetical protein ACRDHD_00990 [Candidatus Limnocylindria bacterium]
MTIGEIIRSGADVGTDRWGIVFTGAEIAGIEARMQYEEEVEQRVAPFVRVLPSYGGMYFDQRDAGRFTVQLTEADAATRSAIENLMPDGPDIAFGTVEEPYAALESATRRVFEVWESLTDLPMPYHSSLDTRANLIRILVDESFLANAQALQPALEEALGVPVAVGVGHPADPQACSSRDYCTNPIKSAVIVRRGSTTGTPCTMAFQVLKNGDEQFLTAAHCALSGSNQWYHKGYGFLGWEVQSLWSGGYDAVRIGLPDAQKTNWMYGDGYVVGWTWPSVGAVLIQNQAVSNTLSFTEVLDDWTCWSYSGQTLCGAKMEGVGGVGGDSGSPLYRFFTSQLYAVGINFGGDGSGNGLMTRLGDVLSRMGVSLVTS